MIDRSRFLIAHGVDPVKWARRFDIEPFEHPCGKCGRKLRTSLPFVLGSQVVGLVAPRCAYGHEHPPYVVVARTGGEILELL